MDDFVIQKIKNPSLDSSKNGETEKRGDFWSGHVSSFQQTLKPMLIYRPTNGRLRRKVVWQIAFARLKLSIATQILSKRVFPHDTAKIRFRRVDEIVARIVVNRRKRKLVIFCVFSRR